MQTLQANNLLKKFGDQIAVNDISLTLGKGEILGMLGRNGAGKTTTIQMLLGILTPTSGNISYFGKELGAHREEIMERVNFSSTYTNMPWDLTVKENLHFISYLYSIPDRKKRIHELIKLFRLADILNQQVKELSAGQLTRVNLAKSFINKPKVLLLDEPTASLDPEVADYIRTFLLEARDRDGVSIIITSHNMSEVEQVCDRVIFIDEGKIIADDTPRNLARKVKHAHLELLVEEHAILLKELCVKNNFPYTVKGSRSMIEIPEISLPSFLGEVMKRGIIYSEISIEKATLEDYFLEVIKR